MSTAPAQFPVLVSINPGRVDYTYFDASTGGPVTKPFINLPIDRPTKCLFALDYRSSEDGWCITGIEPIAGQPLSTVPGPFSLSLMTINPHHDHHSIHRFYLLFLNTLTTDQFKDDPQETNVPPKP